MIALVSFNEHERSLFEKASIELRIEKRIAYFENVDDLFANRKTSSRERQPLDFPRVIAMNIDTESCLDAMAKIKSTPNWKKIPVIGYGALDNTQDVTRFYGAGGASCIRKPGSYAELVETTRAAMGYWLSMSVMPCDYLREA